MFSLNPNAVLFQWRTCLWGLVAGWPVCTTGYLKSDVVFAKTSLDKPNEEVPVKSKLSKPATEINDKTNYSSLVGCIVCGSNYQDAKTLQVSVQALYQITTLPSYGLNYVVSPWFHSFFQTLKLNLLKKEDVGSYDNTALNQRHHRCLHLPIRL